MDSSQWSSRSLHGPRVDHIGHLGRTALRAHNRGVGAEVIQIDQQLEAQADVFAFCEMCPSRSLNVPGGKTVLEIATVDMLEDRLPRRQLSLRSGTVNSPSVTFEVAGKRQSTEERVLGNGAALVAVSDVVDQRERRTSFRYFARCPSNAGDISPDRKRRSRSVRQPRKSSYAASSKRKQGTVSNVPLVAPSASTADRSSLLARSKTCHARSRAGPSGYSSTLRHSGIASGQTIRPNR